jgi:hypothetical protein
VKPLIDKGDEFTCHVCGRSFESSSTYEDAVAEAVRDFGEVAEDADAVCDDCYNAFMEWFRGRN